MGPLPGLGPGPSPLRPYPRAGPGRDRACRRDGFLGGRAPVVGVAARSRDLLIPSAGQRRQFTTGRCLLLMDAYHFMHIRRLTHPCIRPLILL